MKKIVIFGATGNVGSYMTKYMVEHFQGTDYEIIASGLRQTDFFKKHGVNYVSVDLTQKNDFDKLPDSDVYAVILLAAKIPSYMQEYNPEAYLQTNIIGTYNVLEYCRKVNANRILFSTTVFDISLYDTTEMLNDDIPYNFSYKGDHAVYVISKNSAVEMLKHYYWEYGLKYFIFRFPTIYAYSPYHYYFPNGIKTERPIYKMIKLAEKGEPLELWGDPEYKTDMVHVYDCSQMFYKALFIGKECGLYNVGTGHPVTLKEKIETIIEVFSKSGKKSEIIYRPEKNNSGGFMLNIDKAKEELDYVAEYDVVRLFMDYKKEMKLNRFAELRLS